MDIGQRAQDESLSYFGLAALLVALFIPTIRVWQWLTEELGKTAALLIPVIAAVIVLAAVILARLRGPDSFKPRWPYLVVAVVLSGIALLMTDPQFPAKRIHLAEYMLGAFVLRRAICRWVSGTSLIIMTAVLGILFGAHDELIQGMHPDRTFGHRDIAVDAVSAIAGALVGHGMGLFERLPLRDEPWSVPSIWTASALILGVVAFLYPLPELRDAPLPWWTITPLIVVGGVWYLLDRQRRALGDPASLAVWMMI